VFSPAPYADGVFSFDLADDGGEIGHITF
jgi:hypothetical protein